NPKARISASMAGRFFSSALRAASRKFSGAARNSRTLPTSWIRAAVKTGGRAEAVLPEIAQRRQHRLLGIFFRRAPDRQRESGEPERQRFEIVQAEKVQRLGRRQDALAQARREIDRAQQPRREQRLGADHLGKAAARRLVVARHLQ